MLLILLCFISNFSVYLYLKYCLHQFPQSLQGSRKSILSLATPVLLTFEFMYVCMYVVVVVVVRFFHEEFWHTQSQHTINKHTMPTI